MNSAKRACLAYIVGSLVTKNNPASLFDHSRARQLTFSGNVASHRVDVQEASQQCHLSGNGDGTKFELLDHGNGKALNLLVSGKYFRGYDQDTDSHFSGTVNLDAVSIYDFHRPRWYEYSLKTEGGNEH